MLAGPGEGYRLRAFSPQGETVELPYSPPLGPEEADRAFAFVARANAQLLRSSSNTNFDEIRQIGERLFNSICQGRVWSLYSQAQDVAREQGKSLRIRLVFDEPQIAALPWEFLYDPARRDFVSLSLATPVVRQWQGNAAVKEPVELKPPLNILLAAAEAGLYSPEDYQEEIRFLEEHSENTEKEFNIVRNIRHATPSELLQPLNAPCHILHLIASGDEQRIRTGPGAEAVSAGSMFVNAESGATASFAEIKAEQLRAFTQKTNGLQLVYFSGDCTDRLAAQLAADGLATIGWRGRNTVEAYYSFARGFYTALLAGAGLEAALTKGRRAIDSEHPGSKEWGMAVLYLQAEKGFAIAAKGSSDNVQINIDLPSDVADPGVEKELKKLKARLWLEEKNKEAVEAELKRFPDNPPDYINSQHRKIEANISELTDKIKQFK